MHRFLVASALGNRRTACAMFPGYLPRTWSDPLDGSGDFRVLDTSLGDREHPTVFAAIDGIRGYFVLERVRRSLVIVAGALD